MNPEGFKNFILTLWLIPGVGPVKIKGAIEKAFSSSSLLQSKKLITDSSYDNVIRQLGNDRIKRSELDSLLNTELELMHGAGINFITYWCDEYPLLLKEIYSHPIVLFYKGDPSSLNKKGVAIVGSRKSSTYAESSTRKIISEIKSYDANIPIVSGLAYGIDTTAHTAAISSGAKTVAVLANGLMNIYPRENKNLADSIIATGGCLVTELPGTARPLAVNFPLRNRIISGLSAVTLVMEASEKSGSLITSRYALDQNREVYALPGQINDTNFIGCNNLIQNSKAALLTSAENFLYEIFPKNTQLLLVDSEESNQAELIKEKPMPENETEAKIINLLSKGVMQEEIIGLQSKVAFNELMVVLAKLEMRNIVKRLNGGFWELS